MTLAADDSLATPSTGTTRSAGTTTSAGAAPSAGVTPTVGAAISGPGAAGPAPPQAASTAVAAEDIRDIRGPKPVTPDWLLPVLVVAGALLLAALGYAIWRWHRSRRRARALRPFEVALQRLESIKPLMEPKSAREFSIAVSDIVRTYIEERFQVTAAHRTTEEFLRDLLDTRVAGAPLARHRGLLAEFLQQCDLVKFAGVSLSVETMESLHRSGRSFVIETAQPEPEAAGDTTGATAA